MDPGAVQAALGGDGGKGHEKGDELATLDELFCFQGQASKHHRVCSHIDTRALGALPLVGL